MKGESELKIARVIRRNLEKDDVTIRRLSKELEIPMSTIFNYMVNRMPRNPEHIRKLCQYFSITADELLFDIKQPVVRDVRKGDVIRGIFRVVDLDESHISGDP